MLGWQCFGNWCEVFVGDQDVVLYQQCDVLVIVGEVVVELGGVDVVVDIDFVSVYCLFDVFVWVGVVECFVVDLLGKGVGDVVDDVVDWLVLLQVD